MLLLLFFKLYMFVSAVSLLSVMCAGLCLCRCLYLSVSVFSFHFALPTSHSPPCLSKNGDQKQNFPPHKVTEGRGRGGGNRRDTQLQGKVSQRVFNIRYESTLIFNEHARSYFSGEIQNRGVEWVIFGELWQTWLEYDTRFGKKDASTSRAIDAAAAMATGPWIKAMWIIMGWLTHNTRPVSLRKLIFKLMHAHQTHTCI